MTLLALGINHKTAPVALRERVTFSPDTLDQALESLLAQPMVQGGVVLSTCNRTELYLSVEEQDNQHEAIIRWLCDYLGIPRTQSVRLGDSPNDLTMLATVGDVVAVVNAYPEA